MTDEIRVKANQLFKQIEDTRAMEHIVDEMMQHPDFNVQINCLNVGSITMQVDDIFSALEYIRDVLREQKENKEDEFRML